MADMAKAGLSRHEGTKPDSAKAGPVSKSRLTPGYCHHRRNRAGTGWYRRGSADGGRQNRRHLADHSCVHCAGRHPRRSDGKHSDVCTQGRHAAPDPCVTRQNPAPGCGHRRINRICPQARRNGLVSLEAEAMGIQDPFLKKALTLAVDGTDLQEMRNMMQLDMDVADSRATAEARVV